MNTDDFEKRIQRQPLRPVPPEWRDSILRTAQTSAPRVAQAGEPFSLARCMRCFMVSLSPHPVAWAALAAIWVLIFALNTSSRSTSPQVAKNTPPAASEIIAGLKDQQQILAELIGPTEPREIERPKRFPSQPHTQRHAETSMA